MRSLEGEHTLSFAANFVPSMVSSLPMVSPLLGNPLLGRDDALLTEI
jgi:hypothetical protein